MFYFLLVIIKQVIHTPILNSLYIGVQCSFYHFTSIITIKSNFYPNHIEKSSDLLLYE